MNSFFLVVFRPKSPPSIYLIIFDISVVKRFFLLSHFTILFFTHSLTYINITLVAAVAWKICCGRQNGTAAKSTLTFLLYFLTLVFLVILLLSGKRKRGVWRFVLVSHAKKFEVGFNGKISFWIWTFFGLAECNLKQLPLKFL